MEVYLTKQELHEFAQWFAFHYGNIESIIYSNIPHGAIIELEGSFEKEREKFPREDIIELVDSFIKEGEKTSAHTYKKGFIKWFAIAYNIYGDCKGRTYQNYETYEKIVAQTSQEWIDDHFATKIGISGAAMALLHSYYQDKINKTNLFEYRTVENLLEEAGKKGFKVVDENGEEFKT